MGVDNESEVAGPKSIVARSSETVYTWHYNLVIYFKVGYEYFKLNVLETPDQDYQGLVVKNLKELVDRSGAQIEQTWEQYFSPVNQS